MSLRGNTKELVCKRVILQYKNYLSNFYISRRIDESAPDTELLFKTFPIIGETITKQLVDSLYCRVSLALYADSTGTLGGDTVTSLLDLWKGLIHLKSRLPTMSTTISPT